MNIRVKHASDTLLEIVHNKHLKGTITYQAILDALGDRAFGIVLLFFALPSALPFSAIPGISLIFSVPILWFSVQMMLARKTLWLPKFLAKKTVQHTTTSKMIHVAVPYLKKIEYFLKPRLPVMTYPGMLRLNGVLIFCLAIFLMMPIPFSNFILAALLIMISLGLIGKDGIFILLSYILSIIYFSSMYLIFFTVFKYFFK